MTGGPPPGETQRTFRGSVQYDGTDFSGWQIQPKRRTVQGDLEAALKALVGERVPILAAGRTDAGVHAESQGISFRSHTTIPARGLAAGMNSRLAADVAVVSLAVAHHGFHATFDALGKLYCYRILRSRQRLPLEERRAWRVADALDAEAMAAAAARLPGTRDFISFRSQPGPAAAGGSTVRTLRRAEVREEGPLLVLEFEGDGFLHHMVRNIVGTLVRVGRGAADPDHIDAVLAARDRRAAGSKAPAHGLTLVRVDYGSGPRATGSGRKKGTAARQGHTMDAQQSAGAGEAPSAESSTESSHTDSRR